MRNCSTPQNSILHSTTFSQHLVLPHGFCLLEGGHGPCTGSGWACHCIHTSSWCPVDSTPFHSILFFPVSSVCWGRPWPMCMFWLSLSLYKSSSWCPVDNHGQALFHMDRWSGAYFTYMDLYGIDFLNTLGLGVLHVASAYQGRTWLMQRSWLSLAWYSCVLGVQLITIGGYPWGWTSLSLGGTMFTTLTQCGITSVTFFNSIHKLYTMALPSAMAISLAFHVPHIMACLGYHPRTK